jgi:hypothetical protein
MGVERAFNMAPGPKVNEASDEEIAALSITVTLTATQATMLIASLPGMMEQHQRVIADALLKAMIQLPVGDDVPYAYMLVGVLGDVLVATNEVFDTVADAGLAAGIFQENGASGSIEDFMMAAMQKHAKGSAA